MELETVIPAAYDQAKLDDRWLEDVVHPPSAIPLAKEALAEPLVLLTGPTGTGKSMLAVAMVRTVPGARYLFRLPSRAGALTREEQTQIRNEAIAAPALLIDDLIVPAPQTASDKDPDDHAEMAVEWVETILHGRVASKRLTVVTTLATREEVERGFSLAVARWVFDAHRICLDPTYDWSVGLDLPQDQ